MTGYTNTQTHTQKSYMGKIMFSYELYLQININKYQPFYHLNTHTCTVYKVLFYRIFEKRINKMYFQHQFSSIY